MQKINAETLYDNRKMALLNARELLNDAQILFESKRWARCFFLVQIATEELGKYGIIISSAMSIKHGSINISSFIKRFKNHKEKTRNILMLEDLKIFIDNKGKSELFNFDSRKEHAEMQEQLKFRALYADFDERGTLCIPSQLFGRDICSISIKLLEKRVRLMQSFENDIASKFDFNKITKEEIDDFYNKIGLNEILKKR
ncbi:MAG: AbiV family abortive infection protein [Methanobacteriota archaeon]